MEKWLFIFDGATGEISRIEKIDPHGRAPQELSESEYAVLDSYMEEPAIALTPPAAAAPQPTIAATHWAESALVRAYWQGMADCAAFHLRRTLT